MTVTWAAYESILGGVLTLDAQAFRAAVSSPVGVWVAATVIVVAGLSESVGQSVVLFANRIKASRFIFALLADVLLFAFGYAFLLLSTWAIVQLPGRPHTALYPLAIAFAASYVPYWLAFLVALPYLGFGIGWLLRAAHLVVMVVAIGAVADISVFEALVDVLLGWIALSTAQQTIGKPIALLGEKLLNAVAGVDVTSDEQLAIDRATPAIVAKAIEGSATAPAGSSSIAVAPKRRSGWWTAIFGLLGMAMIGYICAVALAPMRHVVFGWQEALPKALQLPLDLLWIGLIGVLVAGFMAPLETLGWWAGWYGDDVKTAAVPGKDDGGAVARYVVYLDGISQSGERYTPDVETFLDALGPRLPAGMRLVRGVMAYSVINRPLDEDPVLSWFWTWIDRLRFANPASLIGMFVNLRNVLIVAVSADTRYGPIYNFGIAQLVYDSLIAAGYRRNSGTPVTFVGYSGGGQMAAACAYYVKRALDAPIDIISLGGVMSGNSRFLELEHLYHFIGERDNVQRLGPCLFPSRWKIAVLSSWNRALYLGRLSIFGLGPVGHQVPGGMMDPGLTLPSGETALDQTLERIDQVLTGRIERHHPSKAHKPNNYTRYIADPLNQPKSFPAGKPSGDAAWRPAAEWIGRLVLPARGERKAVDGALFEVHHAPLEHAALAGSKVPLRWSDFPATREAVRAVKRDVHFSAQAERTCESGELVQPVRVDHWQLVDPLESLAGSHPVDDIVVALPGRVSVDAAAAAGVDARRLAIRIDRQPVQITGRYRALVRFIAADGEGWYRCTHYDRGAHDFTGPETRVRLPRVAPDDGGREPALATGWEGHPLNPSGWYVHGTPDAHGEVVVQSMLPRRLFALEPDKMVATKDAYRYVRRKAWKEIVAAKGGILNVQLGDDEWKLGDRALMIHLYGGIGGKAGERAASGPVYFGHFAYGFAEVVDDELSGEPRFDGFFEQVYTHNSDGLVAGALDFSRYLGDRQFGWAGLRPTCNILLKLDAFTGNYDLGEGLLRSPLDELLLQLEVMTARYRIGDGTGATYVGAANNCSQDSNRALFAALEVFEQFSQTQTFREWKAAHPADSGRLARLSALTVDLRARLEPFGHPRSDWSENRFNLGVTMAEDPLQQIRSGLASWRVLLPRLACDTIVGAFFKHGATGRLLATGQLGDRPDISPVVPMTL